jgi:hypothetical protein
MNYSNFQLLDKLLLGLIFSFVFTIGRAQSSQKNTLEIGRTFYSFPKWKSSLARELTLGSLYYSRKTTIHNTALRWSADANLFVGILTKDKNPTGKVVERRQFFSNVCIGKDLLESNKKHDLYLNTGIALRAGYEYFLVYIHDYGTWKEGFTIDKILWIPGVNFSMDYTYHVSKNFIIHPFIGVNVFAERTYAYAYSGVNVGWAFGKKEK